MPRTSSGNPQNNVNRKAQEKLAKEALLALEGYGGPFLAEEKKTMLKGLAELEKRFLDEGEVYISWQVRDLKRLVDIIGPEGVNLLVESYFQ